MSAFWICCQFPHLALEALGETLGVTLDLAGTEARPLALVSNKVLASNKDLVSTNARQVVNRSKVKPRSALQIVQACNDAARAMGVTPGMTLTIAYSHCPQLLCHDRQPKLEIARLRQLADIAYGFTSDISLAPPHGLLLECLGSLKLFGGATALLRTLQSTWQQLAHRCDFGIAHTPLAAEVLARARMRLPEDSQTLAVRTRSALAQVQLVHMPWASKIIERFAASGLRTLGEVLALPRAAVGRRFGEALLHDLDRLTGALPDPRSTITPQPHFASTVQLLEDLRHRDGLAFPMRRLLQDLHAWLRLRQLATDQIQWRFSYGNKPPVQVEVTLASPTLDAQRLLALSRIQLERCALLPEISAVHLQSLNLRPLQGDSLALVAAGESRRQKPADLLDLFHARLGEGSLHGIRLSDDHRPELGWCAVAPEQNEHSSTAALAGTSRSFTSRPFTSRPLWLLPEPQPITNPALQLLRGPERIDVGWWAGSNAPRDYYVARDQRGVLCWVYLDYRDDRPRDDRPRDDRPGDSKHHGDDDHNDRRRNERWYLHGYFA